MCAETNSKSNKLHKKVKLASERSRNSMDAVETLEFKNKGFRGNKKVHSRTINADGVSSVNDKLYGGDIRGKRRMKSKTKNEHVYKGQDRYDMVIDGNIGFKPVNFDQKRKRVYVYADRRTLPDNIDAPNRKDLSKPVRNKLKDDFVKEKRTTKGGSHDFEQSSRKNSAAGGRKSNENNSLDKKGGKNLRSKIKALYNIKDGALDGSSNGMLSKSAKSKSDSSKQPDQSQNKRAAAYLEKSRKKKVQDKKSLADDSEVTDVRPKKRKRVIRIDPHDITNKRLDDDIVTKDNTKEKKEDLENNKNVEMSQNAQFRAIQPSPSILSFVEDNLLGRRREIVLRRAGYNTELSAPLDNIPFSTSLERERIEETVFRNKLTFFAAAKISSSFPPADLPEIAFAGRSNVGKSSLLNSLTRQWGVVRTSDKPGLTQTINFFKLGSKLCLVDLPGYGFAYAKEEAKEAWEELVKEYVSTRIGLKRVCLLIDTKWGMKPRDDELIDLMERSQTKYQIVLTKTDLVFPIDVARRAMQIEESLKAKKSVVQPVMMVSSKSGAGIQSLRTVLAKIGRFAKL